MNWVQFAVAALGVFSLIAGGLLKTIEPNASGMLIAFGAALTGFAIPWPVRRNGTGYSGRPPAPKE